MYGVLIIEDDPKVASVNKRFTEKLEQFYVIDLIGTGSEAVSVLKELSPDLVLLDIFLPELDGLEVLKLARSQQITTDFIVITASNNTKTISEALRYGVLDYMVKPFQFERFQTSLNNYLKIKNILHNKESIVQKEVDELLAIENNEKLSELPKGLGSRTLEKLLFFLNTQTDFMSSQEIASKTGISRVTVRRYLEHLEELGKVEVDLVYGNRGRPIQLYKVK